MLAPSGNAVVPLRHGASRTRRNSPSAVAISAGPVLAAAVGIASAVAAAAILLTNYLLFFLHWGEVVRVGGAPAGLVVYGTRPYDGEFAWVVWFWGTWAGFCAAGILFVAERSLGWLVGRYRDRPWWVEGARPRLDFSWRFLGLLLAATALAAVVGAGCVRNEPYRRDFTVDPAARTFTFEAYRLDGLVARVLEFDEVAQLRYDRGPEGENTPGTSDVSLVLRSGERVELMSGWPKYAYEFAEGMVMATGWASTCTRSNGDVRPCKWGSP